jgi:hypothetical protein
VSSPEIEQLVEERSLGREPFEDGEVAAYWAKAVGLFADAQASGLSIDGAFQLTYTARRCKRP